METKSLIQTAVAVLVVVVVFTTILVPVVNDVSDASIEKFNNSSEYYAKAGGSETITFEQTGVTATNTYTWKVNGVTVYNDSTSPLGLIYGDGFIFNAGEGNNNIALHSTWGAGNYVGITAANMVYSDGHLSATFTYDGSGSPVTRTFELDVDWLFYAYTEGDYMNIHVTEDTPVYLNNIDQMYGANFVYTTVSFYSFHGLDVKEWTTASPDANEITATANLTEIAGIEGASTLTLKANNSDYSFVVDHSGEDYTVSPWNVIVPAKVIGEKISGGKEIASLISIIPLLIIVGLILSVIGIAITRRYDL